MTEHAKYSLSKAGRWVNCTGSVEMESVFPDKMSEYAEEGTTAHWCAEQKLTTGSFPAPGSVHKNGIVVSEDMLDYVRIYTDFVSTLGGEPHIEEKIVAKSIHETDCFGTPDFWCIDTNLTIHVPDLKYGWGIVDPVENYQLIGYASGIIDQLGIPDNKLNVKLHIVQPRPYHRLGPIRSWEISAVNLRPFINQLYNAANNSSPCLVSGQHCKYCKAMLHCEANRNAAFNAVNVGGLPVKTTSPNLGREISIFQEALTVLKNRVASLEEQGISEILNGNPVDGLTIERGPGRSKWTKPVKQVFELGEMMGIDLRKNEPITPVQAKKKGMPEQLVNASSEMSRSSYKLVPVDKTIAGAAFKNGGN